MQTRPGAALRKLGSSLQGQLMSVITGNRLYLMLAVNDDVFVYELDSLMQPLHILHYIFMGNDGVMICKVKLSGCRHGMFLSLRQNMMDFLAINIRTYFHLYSKTVVDLLVVLQDRTELHQRETMSSIGQDRLNF